jgi:hypothetical protein
VSRETYEKEDDIVMIFEMKTWMALRIYGNSQNEWQETSRSILFFSKWSLTNVQNGRSYKGDMVQFSNQNHFRRDRTEMMPNLAH